MNTFYNQMFNSQYVSPAYYYQISQQQHEAKQCKEVTNAVKAIHDLCEAVKQLDEQHCAIAFNECIFEMAREFNW